MKFPAVAASLFLFGASLAIAAEPAKQPDYDPNERVCFTEPKVGSHIKKRTCMTRKQFEAKRQADQEAMKRLRSGRKAGGKGQACGGMSC